MIGFTYDGVHSSSHIRVQSINRSALPPVQPRTMAVPGRPGVYYTGYDLGPKGIGIRFALLKSTREAYQDGILGLAAWLRPRDPVELEFDDAPGKYHLATITGSTPIARLKTMGQGAFTFLCPDPLLYGAEESAENGFIDVEGTYPTYPRIEVEFAAEAMEFLVERDPPEIFVPGSGHRIRVVHDFIAGDTLAIDCARALVTINDQRAMTALDLNSDFFALNPGLQEVRTSVGATIHWAPRWL